MGDSLHRTIARVSMRKIQSHGNVTGGCKGLRNILSSPAHQCSLSATKMNVVRQWWTYHAPNFKCLITNYPHVYLFSLPDGLRLTLRPGCSFSSLGVASSMSFFHLPADSILKATAWIAYCLCDYFVCSQVSVLEVSISLHAPVCFIMGELRASSWNLV